MMEESKVMPYTFHVAVPKVAFQARNTCRQRDVIREFKVCVAPKPPLDLLDFVVRFIDTSVRRTKDNQPRGIQDGALYGKENIRQVKGEPDRVIRMMIAYQLENRSSCRHL